MYSVLLDLPSFLVSPLNHTLLCADLLHYPCVCDVIFGVIILWTLCWLDCLLLCNTGLLVSFRMKTGARWLMNMFINIRLVLVAMEKW